MKLSEAFSPEMRQAAEAYTNNIIVDQPVFNCDVCTDRGFFVPDLRVGEPGFGKPIACPFCEAGTKTLERVWRNRLGSTALPDMYRGYTFQTWAAIGDELKTGKALAYATAALFVQATDCSVNLAEAYQMCGRSLGKDDWRKSLIFQGPMGVGKTGLAAAIINELTAQGRRALYIRTQDFLDSVKARFGKDEAPTPDDVVQTVRTAPVLVLDEFNVAIDGEWRQEIIEKVIRYRYGNNLPTIATCNATRDELTEQWGGRTTSVLFAMSHWIPMGGPVLRNLMVAEGKPF